MTFPKPDELLALMPFATDLGIELVAASPAEAVGRMTWAPQRCTAGGLLHGGVLMTQTVLQPREQRSS